MLVKKTIQELESLSRSKKSEDGDLEEARALPESWR